MKVHPTVKRWQDQKKDLSVILSNILDAVDLQAKDDGLWTIKGRTYFTEMYLQDSLRDLHHVIEETDPQAINRMRSRIDL